MLAYMRLMWLGVATIKVGSTTTEFCGRMLGPTFPLAGQTWIPPYTRPSALVLSLLHLYALCATQDRGVCAVKELSSSPKESVTPTRSSRTSGPKCQPRKVCLFWNSGMCMLLGTCEYLHECNTCHEDHKANDCDLIPADSSDQSGPGLLPSGQDARAWLLLTPTRDAVVLEPTLSNVIIIVIIIFAKQCSDHSNISITTY